MKRTSPSKEDIAIAKAHAAKVRAEKGLSPLDERGEEIADPDRVSWRSNGFVCLARFNPLGFWCGYVGVSPGHPWHGKHHDDIDANVHGGVTYAGNDLELPGGERLWVVGFDCGHAGDAWNANPGLGFATPGAVYRDKDYVMRETEQLAAQAREAAARGLQ